MLHDGKLSAGDLLKYDGEKFIKALAGSDYGDVAPLTWTPRLEIFPGTAISGISYSNQRGTGLRIENLVVLCGLLKLSAKGTAENKRVCITGMPYLSQLYAHVGISYGSGIPGGAISLHGEINVNAISMYTTTTPDKGMHLLFFADISDSLELDGITAVYFI